MNHLKSFSMCLVALALTSNTWAEIYETTDAEGNPVFTDTPAENGSHVVDLPTTNVADAPPDIPQSSAPAGQQPGVAGGNSAVKGNQDDGDDYGGGYDDNYDRARATPLDSDAIPERLHSEKPMNPSAPHEVIDAEVPHTVGDFNEPQSAVDRRALHPRR